jgi:hypothetical protein
MNNKDAIEVGEKYCRACLFFNTKKTEGRGFDDDNSLVEKNVLKFIDHKFGLNTLSSCLRIFDRVDYSTKNYIFKFYEEFAGALGIIKNNISSEYSILHGELFLLGAFYLVLQVEKIASSYIDNRNAFFLSYTLLQYLQKSSFLKDIITPTVISDLEQMAANYDQILLSTKKIRVKYWLGQNGETATNIVSILFLSADPTNASRLRLSEEFREIDEQLRQSKYRERFKLALPQLSLRPKDISGALLNMQPQIVHFSCHGTSEGALCFENEIGQTHLVQPDALAALFEKFSSQVKCVLLNACYTDLQAKAIAQYIEYVIGMNQAIGDKAAIAFAIGFYQALGAGRTIEEAYELGRVQIMLIGITGHLAPVLIKKKEIQS